MNRSKVGAAQNELRHKGFLYFLLGRALVRQNRFGEGIESFRQSAHAREQLVALPEAHPADRNELERTYKELSSAQMSVDQNGAVNDGKPKPSDPK
jgi:hypothetical protein